VNLISVASDVNVTDEAAVFIDGDNVEKKIVVDVENDNNVGEALSSSFSAMNQQSKYNNNNESSKTRFTKRQISRELFIGNRESNQQCDKSFNDNNRSSSSANSSFIDNKGSKAQQSRSGKTNRKVNTEFNAVASPFTVEVTSPQFGCSEHSMTNLTSTPFNNNPNASVNRFNRSFDNVDMPGNSSTPNSFSFGHSKTSFSSSLDQSFQTNRSVIGGGGGNSTKHKSFDKANNNNNTNSINRRNTSSPFCLGDFINTSSASSTGKGGKKKNQHNSSGSSSQSVSFDSSMPKFSSNDFPSLNMQSNAQAQAQVQQQHQTKGKMSDGKPKKRVAPITVSRKANASDVQNFISSSFQCENNLLNVTMLEVDESKASVADEREMLREHRDAISKDFNNDICRNPSRNLHALIKENFPASPNLLSSSPLTSMSIMTPSSSSSTVVAAAAASTPMTPHKSALDYDKSKVDRCDLLMIMAKLYSFLIDMNHVPNILSEISYLVNLLNTEHNPYEHHHHYQQHLHTKAFSSHMESASHLLKNFHNCIYFVTCVLNYQKQTLGMLDYTTIRVLCDYQRVRIITPSLHEYLRHIMQKKIQMGTMNALSKGENHASRVVFYQQETDNRDNFPSDKEFCAFKKQRDIFYMILR
jgi:codanin-1